MHNYSDVRNFMYNIICITANALHFTHSYNIRPLDCEAKSKHTTTCTSTCTVLFVLFCFYGLSLFAVRYGVCIFTTTRRQTQIRTRELLIVNKTRGIHASFWYAMVNCVKAFICIYNALFLFCLIVCWLYFGYVLDTLKWIYYVPCIQTIRYAIRDGKVYVSMHQSEFALSLSHTHTINVAAHR